MEEGKTEEKIDSDLKKLTVTEVAVVPASEPMGLESGSQGPNPGQSVVADVGSNLMGEDEIKKETPESHSQSSSSSISLIASGTVTKTPNQDDKKTSVDVKVEADASFLSQESFGDDFDGKFEVEEELSTDDSYYDDEYSDTKAVTVKEEPLEEEKPMPEVILSDKERVKILMEDNRKLVKANQEMGERMEIMEEFLEFQHGDKFEQFLKKRERLESVMGFAQAQTDQTPDGKRTAKSRELVGVMRLMRKGTPRESSGSASTSGQTSKSSNKATSKPNTSASTTTSNPTSSSKPSTSRAPPPPPTKSSNPNGTASASQGLGQVSRSRSGSRSRNQNKRRQSGYSMSRREQKQRHKEKLREERETNPEAANVRDKIRRLRRQMNRKLKKPGL